MLKLQKGVLKKEPKQLTGRVSFCETKLADPTFQRYTPEEKYDTILNHYYPVEKDELYILLRELKPRPNCIRRYAYPVICNYLNKILEHHFKEGSGLKVLNVRSLELIIEYIQFLDNDIGSSYCGWTGDEKSGSSGNNCKKEIDLSTLVRAFFEVLLLIIHHIFKDGGERDGLRQQLSRLSIFFFFIGKRTYTIPLSIYEEYFEKINVIVGRKFFIIDCPEDTKEVYDLRPRYPCGRAFTEIDRGELGRIYVLYNTKGIDDDTQDTLRVAIKYTNPEYDLESDPGSSVTVESTPSEIHHFITDKISLEELRYSDMLRAQGASVPKTDLGAEPERSGGKRRRTRRTKKYKTKRR
jgi:hypothetical protein